MKQLSGLDASFLYNETANAPMHIAGLQIYDPSTAPGGSVRFKQIIENVRSRAHDVPCFYQRLVEVPFNLDHPYWINSRDVDAEFHIRHIALPAPGDWRQLCIQIARLHSRDLDRRHPLWEMYVIEGLDNVEGLPSGCYALFTKIHHAAVDGVSGVELTAALHDLEPDPEARSPGHWDPEPEPNPLELVARANFNNFTQPFRFFETMGRAMPGIARFAQTAMDRGERPKLAPRTRFSGTVSSHRVFESATLDLAALAAIRKHVDGATINDVVLTIVGGALRKYLAAKSELPGESLIAMAPISVRTKEQAGAGGNQVSQMSVGVGSDIEDPLDRLTAVHDNTRGAKEMVNAIGAKTMTDFSQFVPSTTAAMAARLASELGMANAMQPVFNTVVTNVPGPQIPLYHTGAKLVRWHSLGPVLDGMGIFHGIQSYCGELAVAVTACRSMMPDPAFYRECIEESFAELSSLKRGDPRL